MANAANRSLAVIREAHIYLSMFALLVVGLFAATGFMLNHGEWFGVDDHGEQVVSFTVADDLPLDPADPTALAAAMHERYGVAGAMTAFENDGQELRLVFERPGRRDDVSIRLDDRSAERVTERAGLAGLLADLHTGKAAPRAWRLAMDAAAVCLLLVSVTGLVLSFKIIARRRRIGLIALACGSAVCVAVAAAALL